MSEVALIGSGIGIGLVISAVVMFAYRDELTVAFRERFGGDADEPRPLAVESVPSAERRSRRRKTRLTAAFGFLAGISQFAVGIAYGQTLPIVTGTVSLLTVVTYVWSSLREGLL